MNLTQSVKVAGCKNRFVICMGYKKVSKGCKLGGDLAQW